MQLKFKESAVYNSELCDETICEYSVFGYSSYNNGPYFYFLDKDVHAYSSWYYYGHDGNSTGTSFHNE